MGRKEIQHKANDIVNRHIKEEAQDALGRVEQEIHGEGCGCRNCVTAAVNAANAWVRLVARGDKEVEDEYSFHVEEVNGRLKIIPSKSWQRSGKI